MHLSHHFPTPAPARNEAVGTFPSGARRRRRGGGWTVWLLLAPLLLTAGCRTTLPRQWANFKAYYNTFYNAKTTFEEGLEKNQNIELEFVEGRPIRIFDPPGQAGKQEFANTIEKGADILRDHEASDYVDPALFLIGKAYFYRTEYFSALQKFEELARVTEDPVLRQEAVFWKSRALYQLNQFDTGIAYTSDELLQLDGWRPELEARTALMLAEHHVVRENTASAIRLLDPALPQIEERTTRARGYFLLGQLLEQQGDPIAAEKAYARVARSKVDYELVYQALKRQAVTLRQNGRFRESADLFRKLIRDDKNLDARIELGFERNQTLYEAGETDAALEGFLELLRERDIDMDRVAKARTYKAIGDLYRLQVGDFRQAAAYYDSAAAIRLAENERPVGFDADELAASFGQYAKLRQEIHRMDSLLALARMDVEQRDSVVQALREVRYEALKEELERQRQEQSRMVVVNTSGGGGAMGGTGTGQGFLNHLNPQMVDDAKTQFQALWGGRPLVDDWRVLQMVQQSGASAGVRGGTVAEADPQAGGAVAAGAEGGAGALEGGAMAGEAGMGGMGGAVDSLAAGGLDGAEGAPDGLVAGIRADSLDAQLDIDLTQIPVDSARQAAMQADVDRQSYELANVFTFALEVPDSARALYAVIADRAADQTLKGQSLYILSDMAITAGDSALALGYARRVMSLIPASVYAERIARRFELDPKDFAPLPPPAVAARDTAGVDFSADSLGAPATPPDSLDAWEDPSVRERIQALLFPDSSQTGQPDTPAREDWLARSASELRTLSARVGEQRGAHLLFEAVMRYATLALAIHGDSLAHPPAMPASPPPAAAQAPPAPPVDSLQAAAILPERGEPVTEPMTDPSADSMIVSQTGEAPVPPADTTTGQVAMPRSDSTSQGLPPAPLSAPEPVTLYVGAWWDSTRVTLDEWMERHNGHALTPRVRALTEELALPEWALPPPEPEPEPGSELGAEPESQLDLPQSDADARDGARADSTAPRPLPPDSLSPSPLDSHSPAPPDSLSATPPDSLSPAPPDSTQQIPDASDPF